VKPSGIVLPSLLTPLLLLAACAALLAQQPDRQKLNEQLWEAARTGDAAAVRTLLDGGADVNAKFRYDQTPLFKAAERGHTEVVKLLLERGAQPNLKDTFYGATPITWAAEKGHVEAVRALLEKGAEGADGVLSGGVRSGNLALVRAALEAGKPKPEALTVALAAALASGKAEIAEALREAGAQPPAEVDASTLQSYAGKYKNEQGFVVTLGVKDGRLTAVAQGQPVINLVPLDKTNFRPAEFEGLAFSMVVEEGKVTGFNFRQGPTTTLFKKE
jgi:ankyrin repeat protein